MEGEPGRPAGTCAPGSRQRGKRGDEDANSTSFYKVEFSSLDAKGFG